MKRTITLAAATLIMAIMAFTAITYTSCKTDKCKDVSCMNGGTCTDGTCSCPSGYTGTFCDTAVVTTPATTVVGYKNNAFTPVTITMNSSTQTIPAGGTVYYSGPHGGSLSGSASTSGVNHLGAPIGITYTWSSLGTTYPEHDTLIIPLSVSGSYFFVSVKNKTSQHLIRCWGNKNLPGQIANDIDIPNDSLVHGIAYYPYTASSNVRVESSNHYWQDDTLHLSGRVNQGVIFEVK